MTREQSITQFALRVLHHAGGEPMSDDALMQAVSMGLRHLRPTLSEIGDALRQAERRGYISGTTDDLLGMTLWTLTPKGRLAAQQLG